jgi:hypothetical protein
MGATSTARLVRSLLVVMAAVMVNACTRETTADPMLQRLVAEYRCEAEVLPTRSAPTDTLTVQERCALVRAALATVAKPGATPNGLEPADSAAAKAAYIASLTQQDSTGKAIRTYWSVNLELEGRPYDAEVQIDRSSGTRSAQRTHKPIG